MFEVKLDALLETTDVLNRISWMAGGSGDALGRCAAVLRNLSMTEDILVRLDNARERLSMTEIKAVRASQTLQNIWYQYRMSEREIADYCEQSQISVKRETPSVYRFDWMFDMLNNNESGGWISG